MHRLILAGASIWSGNLSWRPDRSHMGNTICAKARASIVCAQVDPLKINWGQNRSTWQKKNGKMESITRRSEELWVRSILNIVPCFVGRVEGGDLIDEDCSGRGCFFLLSCVAWFDSRVRYRSEHTEPSLWSSVSGQRRGSLRQTYFTSDQAREERQLFWLSFD